MVDESDCTRPIIKDNFVVWHKLHPINKAIKESNGVAPGYDDVNGTGITMKTALLLKFAPLSHGQV